MARTRGSGEGQPSCTSTRTHTNTRLLTAGMSTTLAYKPRGKKMRCLVGHVPHHATIAQTEKILGTWETTVRKARVLIGFDANETFTDPDDQGWRAHSGRGRPYWRRWRAVACKPPNKTSTFPAITHTTRPNEQGALTMF